MNKELAANMNLSHYRILRKIGAGEMDEVYLAQDTELEHRMAAISGDIAERRIHALRFQTNGAPNNF